MTYYQYRFSFGQGLTPFIKNLMIIMGAVFLLQKIVEISLPEIYHYFLYYLALVPALIWYKYFLW